MDSTIFTLNIPYGAKSKISKSPNREQFSVSRNAIFLLTISRLICYVFICPLAQLYISFIGLMFIYQISQYIFQSVTFTKIKKPFFSSELVSPPVASELAFLPYRNDFQAYITQRAPLLPTLRTLKADEEIYSRLVLVDPQGPICKNVVMHSSSSRGHGSSA